MSYSSGVRFSRAKPTGSFRVFQPGSRGVASHDETLKDARASASYWTSAVGSPMEIQERFPSGEWVTVQVVKPKRAATPKTSSGRRSHSTKKSALAPKTGMPVRDEVTELEYHRPPTAGEIRFGHGATHYRTFPVEECCFAGTRVPKKWFVASDDGLRYSRG